MPEPRQPMKPQEVFVEIDHLIAQAEPEHLPALSAALAARSGMIAARLLQASREPETPEKSSERLMTVSEVASRLVLRPARVYELVRQGDLPVIRIGPNQLRISENALAKWLSKREKYS